MYKLEHCLAILCLVAAATANIPSYIKICKRNDPQLDQCIIDSVEALRPKIIAGMPELDVPPLEPLKLGHIALARGPQSAKLTAVVTDVKVRGPGNFIIEELKSNLKENRFDFKLLLPRLEFAGKYKMDMKILYLMLSGRGDITGNFTNYRCNVTMQGHRITKDGNEYLEFRQFDVTLKVGKASLHLTKLFNGDPVLGDITNRVINENAQTFISEISPVLEKSLADIFTKMANKITLKFTYNELFP